MIVTQVIFQMELHVRQVTDALHAMIVSVLIVTGANMYIASVIVLLVVFRAILAVNESALRIKILIYAHLK